MMEEKGLVSVLFRRCTMEQKIKQSGIQIGRNIRRIRLTRGIGQTELVRMIQLHDVDMTRETLVKIERGIQHITGSQLRGLRDCLNTTYDELLK
jgi:transcriptional regulator with XRE-family HTH domain